MPLEQKLQFEITEQYLNSESTESTGLLSSDCDPYSPYSPFGTRRAYSKEKVIDENMTGQNAEEASTEVGNFSDLAGPGEAMQAPIEKHYDSLVNPLQFQQHSPPNAGPERARQAPREEYPGGLQNRAQFQLRAPQIASAGLVSAAGGLCGDAVNSLAGQLSPPLSPTSPATERPIVDSFLKSSPARTLQTLQAADSKLNRPGFNAEQHQDDALSTTVGSLSSISDTQTLTPPRNTLQGDSGAGTSLKNAMQQTLKALGVTGGFEKFESSEQILKQIQDAGISLEEGRLKSEIQMLQSTKKLTKLQVQGLLENGFAKRILQDELAIKRFPKFKDTFKDIFHEVAPCTEGKVASYIPQLKNQNPELWGAAVCSIDGQRHGLGDTEHPFCVQSCCKPITYCMALEINGDIIVHSHVGHEPSGRNFNARELMKKDSGEGIPHNPYINAGAIMTASLVRMQDSEWDRFDYVMAIWQKLCGNKRPGFQNNTFMGERATAARNFTLAYMMEEEKAFPPRTDLIKTLEAYFSWCSIEVTCDAMAVLAATLANGGICPLTSERIFTHETVTKCLSIMMSCGMYDFSGKFAFEVGFPAKSGVAGCIMIVIPGVCGMATFSPRLDHLGNSVRGIRFCQALSKRFEFHIFAGIPGLTVDSENNKESTGRRQSKSSLEAVMSSSEKEACSERDNASLLWSSVAGDDQRIRQLAVQKADMNKSDYDKRTALHMAACGGHKLCVQLLLALQADPNSKDLHKNTPLDDAVREHHDGVRKLLRHVRQKSSAELEVASGKRPEFAHSQHGLARLMNYFMDSCVNGPDGTPLVARSVLVNALNSYGLSVDSDPRLSSILRELPESFAASDLEGESVQESMELVEKALGGELTVPNFCLFSEKLESMFMTMCNEAQKDENFTGTESLDVATVDGQRMHLGVDDQYFCADELISVAVMIVAMERLGLDVIRKYTSFEPSGKASDDACLDGDGLPFNPFMWNGLLALIALLHESTGDVLEAVATAWAGLCGMPEDSPVQCDESSQGEDMEKYRHTVLSSIHQSLAEGIFPTTTDENHVVDLFFQLRSIQGTSEHLGALAACIANGGECPWTHERICQPIVAKAISSLLYSCGCETLSGEFSFKVGCPAKSSRNGVIILAIPNVGGVCVASSELNRHGISKGGLKFCFDFSESFNIHSLSGDSTAAAKYDPSYYQLHKDADLCNDLLNAAQSGNFQILKALANMGFDMSYADYDGRSAAHVAAANGNIKVLKFLSKHNADLGAEDRWGVTPQGEATRKGHDKAAKLIERLQNDDMWDSFSDKISVMSHSLGSQRMNSISRSNAPIAAKNMGSSLAGLKEDDEGEEDDDVDDDLGEPNSSSRPSSG